MKLFLFFLYFLSIVVSNSIAQDSINHKEITKKDTFLVISFTTRAFTTKKKVREYGHRVFPELHPSINYWNIEIIDDIALNSKARVKCYYEYPFLKIYNNGLEKVKTFYKPIILLVYNDYKSDKSYLLSIPIIFQLTYKKPISIQITQHKRNIFSVAIWQTAIIYNETIKSVENY